MPHSWEWAESGHQLLQDCSAFLNTRLLASYAFLFYSGHIFLVNYGAQLILRLAFLDEKQ